MVGFGAALSEFPEESNEAREAVETQLAEAGDVFRCVESNLFRIDATPKFYDLLLIAGNLQPAMDHGGIHFQMELQAVGALPETEGLVGTSWRRGEELRALGNVEGVTVPLKNSFGGAKVTQQGVVLGGLRNLKIVPSDLLFGSGTDLCAERAREQLGA